MNVSLSDYPDQQMIVPTTPATGPVTVPMVGWSWWALLCGVATFDNGGGAVVGRFSLTLNQQLNAVLRAWAPAATGIAQLELMCFAPGNASLTVATFEQTFPIGLVPVAGNGSIVLSFDGGDAATLIRLVRLVVGGRLATPSRRK